MSDPRFRYQVQLALPYDWPIWRIIMSETNKSFWIRRALETYLLDAGVFPESGDRKVIQFRIAKGDDYIREWLDSATKGHRSSNVRSAIYYMLGKQFATIDVDVLAESIASRLIRRAPGLALAEIEAEDELAQRISKLTDQFV